MGPRLRALVASHLVLLGLAWGPCPCTAVGACPDEPGKTTTGCCEGPQAPADHGEECACCATVGSRLDLYASSSAAGLPRPALTHGTAVSPWTLPRLLDAVRAAPGPAGRSDPPPEPRYGVVLLL